MATGVLSGTAYPYSEGDIAQVQVGEHGSAAAGNPNFQRGGGKYVAQPTAVSGGDDVVRWLDAQGFVTPHLEAVQIGSFVTSTAAATGTAVTGFGALRDLDVEVRVTAMTGTTPTLNVLLDSRFDGTNWVNLAQSSDIITGTTKQIVHLTRRQTGAELDVTVDADEGTVRAIGFADALRIRHTVSGGTTEPSFSYTVYVTGVS